MKIKGFVVFGVFLIFVVYYIYWNHFSETLNLKYFSTDPAVWGQFGDYIGGVLNPLLSFISIALLIKSLTLQHEANESLRTEVKRSEKAEKLRSFEVLFFNLLDAQKNLFSSFEVQFNAPDKSTKLDRAQAVIEIEQRIELMRERGAEESEIVDQLSQWDDKDQIFGIVRAFYVIVATVSNKLDNCQGFEASDRLDHFRALVNFTDFSQLRLMLIAVQFLDFQSTKYIRASAEFTQVIEEMGLKHDQY